MKTFGSSQKSDKGSKRLSLVRPSMDDVVNPNVKSALSQSPKPNIKSMTGNQHSAN